MPTIMVQIRFHSLAFVTSLLPTASKLYLRESCRMKGNDTEERAVMQTGLLLGRDGLSQVPGEVYIESVLYSQMVAQELQWDDVEQPL